MGLRFLILVFFTFISLVNVGAERELTIFTDGKQLLLYRKKCGTCAVLPMKSHKLYDPSNIRSNIGDVWFHILFKTCAKYTDTPLKVNAVLDAFLRNTSKWCGSKGDEAVENCCSKRARCPMKLKRMKTKGNAKNKNPFTINACDCEKSFANCLKKVDNKEAKKVLKYHFEIFSGTCIIYDNPYTYSEDSKTPKTCIKNTKKPKKWLIRKMYHLR
uniref:PLA2-SepT-1 n=1 Tax=Sepioteuthis australis TaxID=61682 RepID=R4G2M5_9MOLL